MIFFARKLRLSWIKRLPSVRSGHKSDVGTFRTWRDVGFESVMSSKADAYQALRFKLIFFVLVGDCSRAAGSLVQSYGG